MVNWHILARRELGLNLILCPVMAEHIGVQILLRLPLLVNQLKLSKAITKLSVVIVVVQDYVLYPGNLAICIILVKILIRLF